MKKLAILVAGAVAVLGGALLSAVPGQQLPEPQKQFGSSVTGAYEGWFENADGTRGFLVGYFNRNSRQELDVPIGPDNRIEPGGPDFGQPTHFLTGRRWGMFVVTVPKDFGPQDKLTWTIVANGQTTMIPLRLNPDYLIDPFKEIAVGNTPPAVRFDPQSPVTVGPIARLASAPARTASVSMPLSLALWADDDMKYTSGSNAPLAGQRPPVVLLWSKYRGPGTVTFDKARPAVEKLAEPGGAAFSGKSMATAQFSEPGDYVLHATVNDLSGEGGGGGFVCCWTTVMVKVTVAP